MIIRVGARVDLVELPRSGSLRSIMSGADTLVLEVEDIPTDLHGVIIVIG